MRAQLGKSADSLFSNIGEGIKTQQVSEDDVIRLFIRKYGYERVGAALGVMMTEDVRNIALDGSNMLDHDSIAALMWRISAIYLAKTNNGTDKTSKEKIGHWIDSDPELKNYYALVLKRMDLVIGPAMDTIAAERGVRIR